MNTLSAGAREHSTRKPTRWFNRIVFGGGLYVLVIYLTTQSPVVFLGVVGGLCLGALLELQAIVYRIGPNWRTTLLQLGAVTATFAYWYLGSKEACLMVLAVNIAGGADLGSMMIGKIFGRKFFLDGFPEWVNPKKTWEGALGGWLMAILIAWITWEGMRWADAIPAGFPVGLMFTWAALGGIASQVGDALGSIEKRRVGVEDSCELLKVNAIRHTGHGGFLDRIGSHITTVNLLVVIYALHRLISQ